MYIQVSATNPNKAFATQIIPATLPSALSYDVNSHSLYCVENIANGRVWVWNGMSAMILYSGIQNGQGLAGDSLHLNFNPFILQRGEVIPCLNLIFKIW